MSVLKNPLSSQKTDRNKRANNTVCLGIRLNIIFFLLILMSINICLNRFQDS